MEAIFLYKLFIIYMSGKCLKILEKSGNFISDKMYKPWDANLFLDEYLRWESARPHHPYILQWMFNHMETARQKEYDCAI